MNFAFRTDATFARELDAVDPIRPWRDQFLIPRAADVIHDAERDPTSARRSAAPTLPAPPESDPCIYMCGNSLGCMPRAARDLVVRELDDWARLGVEGHLHARNPWLPYHERLRGPLARLVGAMEREVVAMNTLTVNLHLLMVSFYRPTRERFKILIEDSAFPSDSYAVASQAAFHAPRAGFDPRAAIVRLKPRHDEHTLRTEDILDTIERQGDSIALVMLGGVNYLTGQWFDMHAITQAARHKGCVVGWDLAHAVGNVPMRLHDWNVDFAAWCSYKYLNGGPGAVAGAFVHERHLANQSLPRFAGWWGNDPSTRFAMTSEFVPTRSADAWSLSNPPILSMTPLIASLDAFDKAGIDTLREKSVRLTGYLESWIDLANEQNDAQIEIVTPRDPDRRGCQLSLIFHKGPKAAHASLNRAGILCDFREPDVIRIAPVPLYNSFTDVLRIGRILCGGW